MVSLPADEKWPISRYVGWDTDGDACHCFNICLSVFSCILFEDGKRDGASYVYRYRHCHHHHHSSISFSALTHSLRGKQEPAVADFSATRWRWPRFSSRGHRASRAAPRVAAYASGCAQCFCAHPLAYAATRGAARLALWPLLLNLGHRHRVALKMGPPLLAPVCPGVHVLTQKKKYKNDDDDDSADTDIHKKLRRVSHPRRGCMKKHLSIY